MVRPAWLSSTMPFLPVLIESPVLYDLPRAHALGLARREPYRGLAIRVHDLRGSREESRRREQENQDRKVRFMAGPAP